MKYSKKHKLDREKVFFSSFTARKLKIQSRFLAVAIPRALRWLDADENEQSSISLHKEKALAAKSSSARTWVSEAIEFIALGEQILKLIKTFSIHCRFECARLAESTFFIAV